MTNSKELLYDLLQKITFANDRNEALAVVYYLLEHRLQLSRTQVMMGHPVAVDMKKLLADIDRLNRHEPVQYVVETAWFRQHEFFVKEGVLIPRPETELLVEEVLKELKPYQSVVDLCSGSGCIAIAIALEAPAPKVVGIEVSETALTIAQKNASQLQARVSFHKHDILRETLPFNDVDVLVSNPPYVRELEKESMARHVLEYEPSLALFVADDDPLVFYRALAAHGKKMLTPKGKIFVEINSALGRETRELFEQYGYSCQLLKDMEGKDRIIRASK